MPLAAGTCLGPYEILAPVGSGGMGEVYSARDTRLGRTVAIKISAEQFSSRFEREAQAISALNHPHICTLHDIGPNYLIMELVEGETLAARLSESRLSIEETLRYGAQLADALAAAHARGITHRDLKPANVMLAKSGVKVLDFGLAITPEAETVTATNAVIGTPAYMAPEQREGKQADARTDIYAMGLILSEMATGKRHSRDQLAQTNLPTGFAHIVECCLKEDPDARWQSAHDLMVQLHWIAAEGREQPAAPPPRRARYFWIAAVGICFLVAAAAVALHFREAPLPTPAYRFSVHPPEKSSVHSFALSPDGRRLAFSTATAGRRALWLRSLDSVETRLLPGTDDAYNPSWTADGRFILFWTLGKLQKIDVSLPSGVTLPQTLLSGGDTHPTARAASNRHGVIAFNARSFGPLSQLSTSGGASTPLTRLDRSREESYHTFPHFLPDGRRFLFGASSRRAEETGVFTGSLDAPQVKQIMRGASDASYISSGRRGYLLFLQGSTLVARPFDAGRLELQGEPHVLAERVRTYTFSETGVLVYQQAKPPTRRLTWLDRQGNRLHDSTPISDLNDIRLSPEGKRVAFVIDAAGNSELWLTDISRSTRTRFTFHPDKRQGSPNWSPDGSLLVYSSNWEGSFNLYLRAASGTGSEIALLPPGQDRFATSWSRDGQFLVYHEHAGRGGYDLWVLPIKGDRKPFPFLQTEFSERQGQLSPDGRWMAYTSDESGERQVYVSRFRQSAASTPTGPEGKWQVSTQGGHSAKWRPDGKELFYISSDRRLTAVEVKLGQSFDAGPPRPLFELNDWATAANFVYRYDVSSDGRGFLIDDVIEDAEMSPITMVLNWIPALKK